MATPQNTNINLQDGDMLGSGDQINFSNILPEILGKFIAVIEGVMIILLGLFLIRYIRSQLRKKEVQHEQQRNAINLLEKITSGFIIVISITLALKIIGLDMTLLISVAILGLSYGLQDIIKNYVAGILILFKAPFKIGDVVKIRDFTGKVNKMDFQSTTLETFDNRHITIYNSDVMTQSIVNFSNGDLRRIDFDVNLGHGSDIPTAIKIFEKILSSHEKILKSPKFSIIFKKFSDAGPVFTLKFWIQKPCNILKVKTTIATQIHQAFDEQNILSPYIKGIEANDEIQLNGVPEARKTRIQAFYSQPLFAPAPVSIENTAPLQPVELSMEYDAEEPE